MSASCTKKHNLADKCLNKKTMQLLSIHVWEGSVHFFITSRSCYYLLERSSMKPGMMENDSCLIFQEFLIYIYTTLQFPQTSFILLNWWKGKPSGSISCTRKQQPRFYWSCSSVEMHNATPLTPPSAWAELHFQM